MRDAKCKISPAVSIFMNLLNSLKSLLNPLQLAPAEAAARVRSGDAVLVDVREPSEWKGGVAEGAALLPLSDLAGARTRWKPFLAQVGNREILVYCASGIRSGRVAQLLSAEGFRATNTGGLKDWAAAGWKTTAPR
jgi:rhodanese-related sulfurtransferase